MDAYNGHIARWLAPCSSLSHQRRPLSVAEGGDRLVRPHCLARHASRLAISMVLTLLTQAYAHGANTFTWTGATSSLWSSPSNWNPTAVPTAGDTLVFPPSALNKTNTNDLASGLNFSMQFSGTGYTVGGNLIVLNDLSNSLSGITLNLPLEFSSSTSIYDGDFGGAIRLTGPLNASRTQFRGPVDLQTYTLSLGGPSIAGSNASGVISGSGSISNLGTTTLSANNTYTGPTLQGPLASFLGDTELTIKGNQPGSDLSITVGRVRLSGRVGAITLTDAQDHLFGPPSLFVDPATTPPVTSKSLNLGTKTNSVFFINGASPGTQYSQLKVVGSVTIAPAGPGASFFLELSPSFVPAIGQSYTLIDNDGTDPINGTFGQPAGGEGAVFTVNGMYHFRLSYVGGDGNDLAVTRVNLSATTITSGTNPSNLGEVVTFTAAVSGLSPTGTFSFKDGVTTIPGCGSSVLSGGHALCPTNALGVGSHSITATYSGDANNAGGVSSPISQVVNPTNTSVTTLTSGANPSKFGDSVTFTAAIAGQNPTGIVDFKDGGATVPSCVAIPLSNTNALCVTNALSIGSHSITATYGGDANNPGSASSPVNQVVNMATPTATIGASPNPSALGQTVVFTATISSAGAPTGTVNFSNGATVMCSAATVIAGQATCAYDNLPTGARSIIATYSGDGNNAPATSAPYSQTVGGSTTRVLTVSKQGIGSGTVVSVPPGINCGADCTEPYATATPVALIAFPAAGSMFVGWSGPCAGNGLCSISVNAPTGVAATFALLLDVDGNGQIEPLTDGLMVIRYIFGVRGAALIAGAIGAGATRTTPAQIEAYLQSVIP